MKVPPKGFEPLFRAREARVLNRTRRQGHKNNILSTTEIYIV